MTEHKWAIRKMQSTNEGGLTRSRVDQVPDEPLFSSREDCEKRARELNDGNPSEPYFCEQAEGELLPRTYER